jgi:hypothetical protein
MTPLKVVVLPVRWVTPQPKDVGRITALATVVVAEAKNPVEPLLTAEKLLPPVLLSISAPVPDLARVPPRIEPPLKVQAPFPEIVVEVGVRHLRQL